MRGCEHLTSITDGEAREPFAFGPLPDRELLATEPAEQPLQAAGVEKRVRMSRRARFRNEIEQPREVPRPFELALEKGHRRQGAVPPQDAGSTSAIDCENVQRCPPRSSTVYWRSRKGDSVGR